MTTKGVATDALARHLQAAIERVREDMAKVEFWADAMTSFSEPVPDYEADDLKVWVPPEQATRMSPIARDTSQRPRSASRRR
jgi:hypothetical protein